MNMSMFLVMIMLMKMYASVDMKMSMAVFPVPDNIPETDNHIYKAKSNEEPGSNIPAVRFNRNKF